MVNSCLSRSSSLRASRGVSLHEELNALPHLLPFGPFGGVFDRHSLPLDFGPNAVGLSEIPLRPRLLTRGQPFLHPVRKLGVWSDGLRHHIKNRIDAGENLSRSF